MRTKNRNGHSKKRIASVLLAMSLLLSTLPSGVFASDDAQRAQVEEAAGKTGDGQAESGAHDVSIGMGDAVANGADVEGLDTGMPAVDGMGDAVGNGSGAEVLDTDGVAAEGADSASTQDMVTESQGTDGTAAGSADVESAGMGDAVASGTDAEVLATDIVTAEGADSASTQGTVTESQGTDGVTAEGADELITDPMFEEEIVVGDFSAETIAQDQPETTESDTDTEAAKTVKTAIQYPAGVTYTVRDVKTAEEYQPETETQSDMGSTAVYQLVAGATYRWETTVDEVYHAFADFTATEVAEVAEREGMQTLTAVAPKTGEAWLNNVFLAKFNYTKEDEAYEMTPSFSPDVRAYTSTVDSREEKMYVYASMNGGLYEAYAQYVTHPVSVTPGQPADPQNPLDGKKLTNATNTYCTDLLNKGGYGAEFQVVVRTKKADEQGVLYAQDYNFTVVRRMGLESFSGKLPDGKDLIFFSSKEDADASDVLEKDDIVNTTLKPNPGAYKTEVPSGTERIAFGITPIREAGKFLEGYRVTVKLDGVEVPSLAMQGEAQGGEYILPQGGENSYYDVTLHPEKEQQELTVEVAHDAEGAISQTYSVQIARAQYFDLQVKIEPEDATFFLRENLQGDRILPNEDGTYSVRNGKLSYSYTVSRSGYLTQHEDNAFFTNAEQGVLSITLQEAPKSTRADISKAHDWHTFRGENNNGVVNYSTPITSDEAVLSWAVKAGDGWGRNAVSSPIIVGGNLYCFSQNQLIRLDKETGALLASEEAEGQMSGSSAFSIIPPIYADGMILVGLDSMVQAFDAKTLKSLWIYEDPIGGQMNSPITYKDGYIYFGFWQSEVIPANFVCLSVTDEDPTRTDEPKYASWTYAQTGGFYWAGAAVQDGYVMVATDDGKRKYENDSHLLCFDARQGTLVDDWTLTGMGDARSSICAADGAYYFTTKGGYFCKFTLSADGKIENKNFLKLENGQNGVPMSTSTPVVADGRAYIGVSGAGQFVAYSGHNITVIDLDSFSIAYRVETQGYPQVSGLLTTAYKAQDGYNYVYFVDNYTPGKIRVIRDKRGMTGLDGYTAEEVNEKTQATLQTAYNLFTPSEGQAQYAIASLIADEYGNIYFKNDSGWLMCLSPVITELSIDQKPAKLDYRCAGETFQADGMQVTAHYANGMTKDVTKQMTYTTAPLTAKDAVITLEYDLGANQMMYQNKDGLFGQAYDVPSAELDINLLHEWNDGEITAEPTEETPGVRIFTCAVCGTTKTEEIPALQPPVDETPSDPNGEAQGDATPSDPNGGAQDDATPSDPNGEAQGDATPNEPNGETQGDTTPNDPNGDAQGDSTQDDPNEGVHKHTFGKYVTEKEATVFAKGKKTRTCEECGKKESKAIPKLAPTIRINVKSLTLKVGQSTTDVKVSHLAAGDAIASWKSNKPSVAKVGKKGKITARSKEGTAVITVTLKSGLSKKIRVTVQTDTVTCEKVSLNKTTVTLKKGKAFLLVPSVKPITCQQKVKYHSSNPAVATVSAKGKIKAKKKGKATITVTVGKKKVTCKVKVK